MPEVRSRVGAGEQPFGAGWGRVDQLLDEPIHSNVTVEVAYRFVQRDAFEGREVVSDKALWVVLLAAAERIHFLFPVMRS